MTGLSSFPTTAHVAPTLAGMTTQYAARHVALGGDDSEPEGLASSWGDGPAPRRAMMPEDAPASYAPYEPEPELMPYAAVAGQDLPMVAPSPSEFGRPVVAPVPSKTMPWHLASASNAPLDPGPVDATPPVTAVTDPASFPTPVSQYAAVSYQSMPSPAPYASMPAQGMYASVPPNMSYASAPAQGSLASPMASPYANPAPYDAPPTGGSWVHRPQTVEQALDLLPNQAGPGFKTVIKASRIFSLVFILVTTGIFTVVGLNIGGGTAWYIVGFAWFVGIAMIIGILTGRGRVRWSS
jgi:hypothetical protein